MGMLMHHTWLEQQKKEAEAKAKAKKPARKPAARNKKK